MDATDTGTQTNSLFFCALPTHLQLVTVGVALLVEHRGQANWSRRPRSTGSWLHDGVIPSMFSHYHSHLTVVRDQVLPAQMVDISSLSTLERWTSTHDAWRSVTNEEKSCRVGVSKLLDHENQEWRHRTMNSLSIRDDCKLYGEPKEGLVRASKIHCRPLPVARCPLPLAVALWLKSEPLRNPCIRLKVDDFLR